MTLILARKVPKGIIIDSDTKLTKEKKGKEEEQPNRDFNLAIPGVLKIFIVSKDLCFAFSGTPEYAFQALREVVRNEVHPTFSSLKKLLMRYHKKSHGETDFILCHVSGKMIKISDNQFLGRFQARLFLGNSHAVSMAGEDWSNIRHPIWSGASRVRDVGGFCITASNTTSGKFQYIGFHEVGIGLAESQPTHILGQDGDDLHIVGCPPTKIYAPFYAIYLPDANVGYLYDHVHDDKAKPIYADNFEHFILQLNRCIPHVEFDRAVIESVGDMPISI